MLLIHQVHNRIKGILPDFIERALSKISKFAFLHLYVALLQEAQFPKGIKHAEIIAV